jgi:RecA/RadA recombinase
MAKKMSPKKSSDDKRSSFLELNDMLSKFSPDGAIIEDSIYAKIDEWIPTGSYILNAALSGSLFGGMPNRRSLMLAGETGCLHKNEEVEIYVFKSNVSQTNNLDIVQELKYVFKDKLDAFLEKPLNECTDEYLLKKFNEYAKTNSQKIKIKELIDNYGDIAFLINTPDGFNEVGEFYIKSPRQIYLIKTKSNYRTKCSEDHKFETSLGWKFAKDITKEDYILTKEGYRKVNKIKKYKKLEEVYDFEVLHDNHRYWSGNGLSSHNTGKTYLACSIVRNAQAMDYFPIYYDSEGSIDVDFVKRLGIDTSKFRIENVNTVEEFATLTAKLNESINEIRNQGKIPPKIIVVLDSLGNLSSIKEKTDTTSGSDKRDMTKQQSIRRMFRVIGNDFAKNGIPFIIANHTYSSIGSYIPGQTISGGGGAQFNASIIFMLTKSKLTDKDSEEHVKKRGIDATRIGVVITVTPYKQRFARPIKVQIHIPFYKKPNPYVGLEKFVNWETCGIIRGNMIFEKDYAKLSDVDKKKCYEFETEDGKIAYAMPKDTARKLVCKHLKGEIPISELYTDKVFTPEILKQLDDNIIKKTFMLPSIESLEDLAEVSGDLLDGAEMGDPNIDNEVDISELDNFEVPEI